MDRREIVEKVREFKGTPFKHQGRSRKYGVDCIGILVVLGEEYGYYREKPKDRRYSKNPESFRIKEVLDKMLIPINTEDIQIGDILLFRIPFHPQHVSIITDYKDQYFRVIQSYQTIGEVVEHRLDERWLSRVVQAYKIPGVD